MVRTSTDDPGDTAPFSVDGGRSGMLLCHGFTSTPQSLRAWADAVADAGHTVRLPLLPGHGTTWHDLDRTRWPDWFAEVERSLHELRSRCDQVVVAGLSMGGALALRLAQVHRDAVDGLVLVNPSVLGTDPRLRVLPALSWLGSVPGIASDVKRPGVVEVAYDRTPLHALVSLTELWRAVRHDLPLVTQPLLLLRSVDDHVVPAQSAQAVLEGVSSPERTEVLLHESYHVATLDHDLPLIVSTSLDLMARVAGQEDPS